MNPFDLGILLWPASAIFICTLAACLLFTKSPLLSITASFTKAGIYIFYFGFAFDGTYTFNDDWEYIDGAQELLANNIGITNLADNWEFVMATANSRHAVYYLHNLFAFYLFGEGYFAPVALNVLLTLIIAYYGAKLALVEFKMGKSISKLFFLFLLFHPDILAWSSIANLKDVLVLSLHVLLMIAISHYLRGERLKSLWFAVPVIFVLFFLRFYVPLLFAIALVVGILLVDQRGRIGYLLVSFGLALLALVWIGDSGLQYSLSRLNESFVNPLYGFIRFTLTPIPFHTEDAYAFLDIPALFHWAMIPFVLVGLIVILRMKTRFTRVFVMYLFVFIALYSAYDQLQGPRHRVQLDYAFALLQFIGVMAVLRTPQRVSGRSIKKHAA